MSVVKRHDLTGHCPLTNGSSAICFVHAFHIKMIFNGGFSWVVFSVVIETGPISQFTSDFSSVVLLELLSVEGISRCCFCETFFQVLKKDKEIGVCVLAS